MSDPIDTICLLADCSRELAQKTYEETKDIVEAVDKLLEKVSSPAQKIIETKLKKRSVTHEEEIIAPIRKMLKQMDEARSTSSHQHGYEGSVEKIDHHEETALQNNCSQQCQLPSLESEVQKQETVYQ